MGHVHTGTVDDDHCRECGAPKKHLHYATFDVDEADLARVSPDTSRERMTWLNPEDEGYPPPPLDAWAEYDRQHSETRY